jgi:hypothetical protein
MGQAMSNIVKFPRVKRVNPRPADSCQNEQANQSTRQERDVTWPNGIWVFTVCIWPFLKWVVALDCVWQLIRTAYYWNTPGTFAGITFLLHFSLLVGLTYFVSCYQPKSLKV